MMWKTKKSLRLGGKNRKEYYRRIRERKCCYTEGENNQEYDMILTSLYMLSVRFSYKIIIDDSAKMLLSERKPQR